MASKKKPTAQKQTSRDAARQFRWKQKEAELRQLASKLESRVIRRTAELKMANAVLSRTEHEFRTLADNVPALFSFVDATQRYRFVNKAYEDFLGVPASAVIGRKVSEILGDKTYALVRRHIAEALHGKRVHFEVEFELPLGRQRVTNVLYVPEIGPHGRVAGLYALITDLTERKRIAEALIKSELRMRAVVESAADAIITIDEKGIIDSFNPAAERMFGYFTREAIGQNVRILMPSPYRKEHGKYLSWKLKIGETRIIGRGRELMGRRKDGSIFPIDLAVSTLHDGVQQRFTGIIRDLSERQAMQRELLKTLSEEQRRIGQDLHDVVGQELTGLGLLAGSLAEELQDHRPADADAASRLAKGIESALEQVRKLSKGLVPVEVNAEGLSLALNELAARTSRDTRVRCEFECSKAVPVENNETATHLFCIAQEAVANALKHAACRHILISLEKKEGEIVLRVRDDGNGIPRAAWQSDGMGLKTMQYRASLIGGTLSVAGLKRRGTLVTCQFLANRPHHEPAGAEESRQANDRHVRPPGS
jgi:PAS domain S-box-containing protein